jgi:hypothetical protein
MRKSPHSVLPKSPLTDDGPRRAHPLRRRDPPLRPLVGRIAGWSARHRKTAVLGLPRSAACRSRRNTSVRH